jgi:outer membrane PBP1 activator LpoA protein
MLSLQVEAEARVVARLSYEDGRRAAYTLGGHDPLSRRMQEAFVDEFTRLGGTHADGQQFLSERSDLERMKRTIEKSGADMVFLALGTEQARIARPYLGTLALYATSQVYPASSSPLVNFDLPWLLEPDHAAVMIYPRPEYGSDIDLARLYALGIDAFRVGQELLAGRTNIVLDGVTGDLRLASNQQFHRGLLVAQFTDGKIELLGATQP